MQLLDIKSESYNRREYKKETRRVIKEHWNKIWEGKGNLSLPFSLKYRTLPFFTSSYAPIYSSISPNAAFL